MPMKSPPDAAPAAAARAQLVDSLAELYSVRESMRRANRPVMVHCLTAVIKLQTHSLRELDRGPDVHWVSPVDTPHPARL